MTHPLARPGNNAALKPCDNQDPRYSPGPDSARQPAPIARTETLSHGSRLGVAVRCCLYLAIAVRTCCKPGGNPETGHERREGVTGGFPSALGENGYPKNRAGVLGQACA